MPNTAEEPLTARGRSATGRRCRNLQPAAAILLGIALGLAACMPLKNAATGPDGTSPAAAAATSGATAQPHPVALAPSLTGAPPAAKAPAAAAPPAAGPIAARPLPPPPKPTAASVTAVHPPTPPPPSPAPAAAAHPAPAPPPAQPAGPPPAVTAAAVPRAEPPGKPCPPGTLGMWSPPDVIGQSVYVCRTQAAPPR